MASNPIAYGKSRRKGGISDRFYFLGLQNHVGDVCSHEIKRHLLHGRKAMTNLCFVYVLSCI